MESEEIIAAEIIYHAGYRQDDKHNQEDIQANTPFEAGGETGFRFSGHAYFQRRLSTMRKVRNRKNKVRLTKNTTGRVSTTPRAKSCICSNRERQERSCCCQSTLVCTWSARKPSMNKLPPKRRLIIAAVPWLRVIAEAQQPAETNSPPSSTIPRKVVPTAPMSNAAGSLV